MEFKALTLTNPGIISIIGVVLFYLSFSYLLRCKCKYTQCLLTKGLNSVTVYFTKDLKK